MLFTNDFLFLIILLSYNTNSKLNECYYNKNQDLNSLLTKQKINFNSDL